MRKVAAFALFVSLLAACSSQNSHTLPQTQASHDSQNASVSASSAAPAYTLLVSPQAFQQVGDPQFMGADGQGGIWYISKAEMERYNGSSFSTLPVGAASGEMPSSTIARGVNGDIYFLLGTCCVTTTTSLESVTPGGTRAIHKLSSITKDLVDTQLIAGTDGYLYAFGMVGGIQEQLVMTKLTKYGKVLAKTTTPIPNGGIQVAYAPQSQTFFVSDLGQSLQLWELGTSGTVKNWFTLSNSTVGENEIWLAVAPDGAPWLALSSCLDRVDPSTGQEQCVNYPWIGTTQTPFSITLGNDGNLWFTTYYAKNGQTDWMLGKLNPTADAVTEYAEPYNIWVPQMAVHNLIAPPKNSTANPANTLWTAENNTGSWAYNVLRIQY